MSSAGRYFRISVRLFAISLFAASLVALRYVLSIPQALESVLPGKACLYKWTHGSVFYKVLGPSDAPPLVLVHAPEIGASSYEMRNLVDGLARYYRLYVLDLPGFGLSDRPDIAYSATIYSAFLADFLKDVVKRPSGVIASGLSCSYAVALAQSEPILCERLILLAPEAAFKPKKLSRSQIWLMGLPAIALECYAFLTTRFVLRRMIAMQRGIAPQQVVSGELDYLFASAHQVGAHYIWKALMCGKLHQLAMSRLAALKQPVLIIQSSQTIPLSVQFGIQIDSVSIPDSGLRIHEECPARVMSSIIAWLMPHLEQLIPSHMTTVPHTDALIADDVSPLFEQELLTGQVLKRSAPQELEGIAQERQRVFEHSPSADQAPVAFVRGLPDASEVTPQVLEPLDAPSNVTEVTQIEAYCVKCRKKNPLQNGKRIVTKNGRSALEGTCPVCGTKLFRFVSG